MHLCRSSSNIPLLPLLLKLLQNLHALLTFGNIQIPLRLPRNDTWTCKSGPNIWCWPLSLPNIKCASRHICVHFFRFAISKSAPTLRCFCHFDLETRFVPQLCATLFQQRNFQKCSDAEVLLSFWLGNVLRATAVHNTFSATQFPKVLRRWGAFVILTWKCASCHSCAQHFFSNAISKSAPTLRCFCHFDLEMCFVPQLCATLFQQRNFQKCSDAEVLAFVILTWKCASCHNDVQFLIFHPARCLRALWRAYFSTLQSHKTFSNTLEKTHSFATFLLFCAPCSSLYWLFLFPDCFHNCCSLTALTTVAASVHIRKFDFQTSSGNVIHIAGSHGICSIYSGISWNIMAWYPKLNPPTMFGFIDRLFATNNRVNKGEK